MAAQQPTDPVQGDTVAILDSLGDRTCREILRETTGGPLTAREICKRCDSSRSTVYRKLESLTDAGVLTATNRIRTESVDATEFEVAVDRLQVAFCTDEGITVEGVESGVDPD